jgi:hypothetical protein
MADAVKTADELKKAMIDLRFDRKDKIEVLRWILASPMGRKFIWWRLSESQIFSSTIGPHHEMCFREGKRTLGLQLLDLIQGDEPCRKLFNQMQDERIRKEQEK